MQSQPCKHNPHVRNVSVNLKAGDAPKQYGKKGTGELRLGAIEIEIEKTTAFRSTVSLWGGWGYHVREDTATARTISIPIAISIWKKKVTFLASDSG